MKKILLVFLVALSLNGFAQQKDLVWHTDVNKAINISTQSGKPLFLFFTGSDWCGWCKKMLPDYDRLAAHFKNHFSKLKIIY